jgi:hypothetical protein
MLQNGLVEVSARTTEVKTQGQVIEAIFCKPG